MLPEARAEYLASREASGQDADSTMAGCSSWSRSSSAHSCRRRHIDGGPDPTGYGGVIAGYGDQREIELLVEAGFSPAGDPDRDTQRRALPGRGRTSAASRSARLPTSSCIKGNPGGQREDIENVELVFKDGVGYDPAKLVQAANGTVGLRLPTKARGRIDADQVCPAGLMPTSFSHAMRSHPCAAGSLPSSQHLPDPAIGRCGLPRIFSSPACLCVQCLLAHETTARHGKNQSLQGIAISSLGRHVRTSLLR